MWNSDVISSLGAGAEAITRGFRVLLPFSAPLKIDTTVSTNQPLLCVGLPCIKVAVQHIWIALGAQRTPFSTGLPLYLIWVVSLGADAWLIWRMISANIAWLSAPPTSPSPPPHHHFPMLWYLNGCVCPQSGPYIYIYIRCIPFLIQSVLPSLLTWAIKIGLRASINWVVSLKVPPRSYTLCSGFTFGFTGARLFPSKPCQEEMGLKPDTVVNLMDILGLSFMW